MLAWKQEPLGNPTQEGRTAGQSTAQSVHSSGGADSREGQVNGGFQRRSTGVRMTGDWPEGSACAKALRQRERRETKG